jgi:hypothetical protein
MLVPRKMNKHIDCKCKGFSFLNQLLEYPHDYNVGPSSYKLVYLVYLVLLSTNLELSFGGRTLYIYSHVSCSAHPLGQARNPATLLQARLREIEALRGFKDKVRGMGRPFLKKPTWFIWLTNMVNKVKTCFFPIHCGLWYLEIYWSYVC